MIHTNGRWNEYFSTESIMREIILQLWIKKKHYSSDLHESHIPWTHYCQWTAHLWHYILQLCIKQWIVILLYSILGISYLTTVYSKQIIILFVSNMNWTNYELITNRQYSNSTIFYACVYKNRIIIFSDMNWIYYELLVTNLYSDNKNSYNCELE